jgi:hypothetical protein
MNVQEKPPELTGNPSPACGSSPATQLDERHPAPLEAAPDFDQSALSLLESENTGLRRLVVELLEKNQRLREQLLKRTA